MMKSVHRGAWFCILAMLLSTACGDAGTQEQGATGREGRQKSEAAAEHKDRSALSAAQRGRIAAMADSHDGEIHFGPAYHALDPGVSATGPEAGAAPRARFDLGDEFSGLPRTEGHELVYAYCSGCHSLRIVMEQRQSAEGWDGLLTWMVKTQGMAPLPPEEREAVISYLAQHFGSETSANPL